MDSKTLFVFLLSLLLRAMIAPYPHSGQGNHHGSTTAYGGDYEAQRHWMELTLHLPISQWYKYDLSYWGLDYPPLIAFGSYLMGWASQTLVGHETVALFDSRGYEGDPVHKSFMRATVIFWDAVIYFPALYLIICKRYGGTKVSSSHNDNNNNGHHDDDDDDNVLYLWLGCMLSPPMILVDNGHFQYNNVCLGLSLSSFHFMTVTENIGIYDMLGSVLFCLALNWKQMALYYAPAVFSFLLGKSFRPRRRTTRPRVLLKQLWDAALDISKLGLSVVTTFLLIWYPFYHYRQDPTTESFLDVFGPILKRIFPFSRGLFEGKVANLWCVCNIKPISIRSRIPEGYQPLCALGLTMLAIMPFCILLFQIGKRRTATRRSTTACNNNKNNNNNNNSDLTALLWGAAGTSLSFFLASFQVHEKSILLPLAPLALLQQSVENNNNKKSLMTVIVYWFTIACTWSLWHLMVLDRLQVVYFAVLALYMSYIWWYLRVFSYHQTQQHFLTSDKYATMEQDEGNGEFVWTKIIIPCSLAGMVGLHILEAFVSPPPNLPDIFPVLWIMVACMAFVLMWIKSLQSLWSQQVMQLGDDAHYKMD